MGIPSPEEFFGSGLKFFEAGDLDGAISHYTKVLEKDPNNEKVLAARGFLRGKMQDPYGAIDDFNEALKLNPKNVMALSTRGGTYMMLNEFEKSKADLEAVLRLDPGNPQAMQGLEMLKQA